MTLRRRLVDWGLTGLLILIPALVLRASLSRGTPSPFDQAIVRITAPLETGVSWIVEGIGGLWSRYVALVDVESENRRRHQAHRRARVLARPRPVRLVRLRSQASAREQSRAARTRWRRDRHRCRFDLSGGPDDRHDRQARRRRWIVAAGRRHAVGGYVAAARGHRAARVAAARRSRRQDEEEERAGLRREGPVRTATLVLVAYVLCVIVAACWRLAPHFLLDAIPDVGALTAAYLGLHARRNVAPAVGGAVVLGYLIDLIS